jgi:sporulation protein YlmC with PRC-barrel domain
MTFQETAPAAQTGDMVIDYQHELISSRRVEGTQVFNRRGEKLGTIHSVMIGKKSGQVAYALLSFGGFLGVGGQVHPVPWELLTYNVDLDGYTVDLTRDQLKNAPAFRLDEDDRPQSRRSDDQMSQYYGTMNWWGL